MTAQEIRAAFNQPSELDMALAAAGETRQIIDLVWGASLTRFISLAARRGGNKHPLRGRWKGGTNPKEILLNLSPDAPVPMGEWKEVIWQPDSMWIAKWQDKLTVDGNTFGFQTPPLLSKSTTLKSSIKLRNLRRALKKSENI
jgi:hypothetical protein